MIKLLILLQFHARFLLSTNFQAVGRNQLEYYLDIHTIWNCSENNSLKEILESRNL